MKFNIMGFDQEKLYKEHSNLNCNDIVVLRTLIDILGKMEIKTRKDNKEYSWVRYKLLVEDLPFITESESTMKKIVQKLIDAGLIERLVVNQGGKYTYFRKTSKCTELEYNPDSENELVLDKSSENKVQKVKEVLSEKINNQTVADILNVETEILEKAIKSCGEKQIVTNSYFLNALKLASYEPKENNLKFSNFEARQYDYSKLEKKLLGWDNSDSSYTL